MKKNKVKLHFRYNLETHIVSDCNLISEELSLSKFLDESDVLAILKDLNNFNIKRLKDYLETGTEIDKEFVSRTDAKTYVVRIRKNADGEIELTLFFKPPVWAARRTMYFFAAVIVCALIAICVFVVLALRKDMKEQTAAEAQNTIHMISEQIDGTISTELNSWFNELKVVSAMVAKYEVVEGNEKQIDAVLEEITAGLPFNRVGLLLEYGDVYFGQGVSYSIFYEDFAKKLVM